MFPYESNFIKPPRQSLLGWEVGSGGGEGSLSPGCSGGESGGQQSSWEWEASTLAPPCPVSGSSLPWLHMQQKDGHHGNRMQN